MKYFDMDETLTRISKNNEAQESRKILADTVTPKIINKPLPKTEQNNDQNLDDEDNSDDPDDSDDSDSANPEDALKTFPSTATTQPIYDRLQTFGDQAYIVAEIINQVEGFKNANDNDNMQRALAALRAALTDMADIQNKSKDEITKYLSTIKG